jgi:D-alanine-D-alanine ligase
MLVKQIVGVLFGGYSGEAVISQQSALNVFNLVDDIAYKKYLIELNKRNDWWLHFDGLKWPRLDDETRLVFKVQNEIIEIDIVCNVIHGPPGENGDLQKYLDIIGTQHTGPAKDVAAKTFNKHLCNNILLKNNLPVAKNYLHQGQITALSIKNIAQQLGDKPYFIKPNSGGSSLAAGIAHSEPELVRLIIAALEVDDKVLIEPVLPGREFSIGVINFDNEIIALPITEIISDNEFFDYQAKYDGASSEITPADIENGLASDLQQLGKDIFELLGCRDMIRFEVKLDKNNSYKILDINTIPGFTNASILPQQIKSANIDPAVFINQMIDRVIERNN